MRYHFIATVPVRALGMEAGDSLSYDPANPDEPFLLHRAVTPDPGAVLAALNDGRLSGVTPPQLVRAVAAARPPLRLLPSREPRQA